MLPLVSTRLVTSTGQLPSEFLARSSPPTVSPMSWVMSGELRDADLGHVGHHHVSVLFDRVTDVRLG